MKYLSVDIDFGAPRGAAALTPPTSVSWRVFKNPVTVAVGGVAAVLLELAHPQVRAGVWGHSSFRTKPLRRMRRTGLAAMVTVYGPEETAREVITQVGRMHHNVRGVTPDGLPYSALDPSLLTWVQATASYGFLEAYHKFANPLSPAERDQFYREGSIAATLYGATAAPTSENERAALFAATDAVISATPVIEDFLSVLRAALPAPRDLLVRAAVEILPPPLHKRLGLSHYRLSKRSAAIVHRLARIADRTPLPLSPPVLACKRLGLAGDFLFSKNPKKLGY